MRSVMLAILVMLASGAATLAGSGPAAAAYDYPYCIQSAETGDFPSNCYYRSHAQCMGSASGRAAECVLSPKVAFDRARRRPPYPDYRRY